MLKTSVLSLVLLAGAWPVHAQPTPASTPAKKELAARIVKLQQPGIEAMARNLAEQPAAEMMDRAGAALPQRVPAERREAVAQEIQAEVKKYLDDASPFIVRNAARLAPGTVGALLEEKFSEDELKQIVAIIEAPAYLKFQQLGGEMQKVLADKLVAETRAVVEPKVRALEQAIARRLGVPAGTAAPAAAAPAAPARPASR